jgi:hypothetical protein
MWNSLLGNKFRFDMEFLISSLGGIPLGIKNGIDVEFPIYPWEFPGYKGKELNFPFPNSNDFFF